MIDCFVYNTDKTQKYAIIEGKCGDDYVNTRNYDDTAVAERARFSYTVFEFVDAVEGEENQTLQDQLLKSSKSELQAKVFDKISSIFENFEL